MASAVPTAQGGTITTGVYYLTGLALYTGPGGASGPITGDTSGATLQYETNGAGGIASIFETENDGCTNTVNYGITFTGGAGLTAAISCPSGCTHNCGGNALYTATSGTPPTFALFMEDQESGGGGGDGGEADAGVQYTVETYTWQHS